MKSFALYLIAVLLVGLAAVSDSPAREFLALAGIAFAYADYRNSTKGARR